MLGSAGGIGTRDMRRAIDKTGDRRNRSLTVYVVARITARHLTDDKRSGRRRRALA